MTEKRMLSEPEQMAEINAKLRKKKEADCPECGSEFCWGCGNPACPYPSSMTGGPTW